MKQREYLEKNTVNNISKSLIKAYKAKRNRITKY